MILPAFGVTIDDFETLRGIGCVMVDTTCGSVLNVWKRVEAYARDGYTSLIHGKYYHEETRATASQAVKFPDAPSLRRAEHGRGQGRLRLHRREGLGRRAHDSVSPHAVSPGFDPERAPEANRRREPDDDAGQRVAGDRRRSWRRRWRARTATSIARATSGPSTRSAARHRSGRTRSRSFFASRST